MEWATECVIMKATSQICLFQKFNMYTSFF